MSDRKGDWRKRLSVNEGFPPGDTGKDMKHRFQSLLSRFADNERLQELFLEIRGLPPPGYSDEEWRVLEALYKLLVLANAQLYLLFAERNQVDFTGLSLAALRALGNEDSPTDLVLYLDYRIRHILVDEYQDVSINQGKLLEKLTAGWAPEDGHSLFLVGDPMQSIYRFRDAEVGVFLATWEQQRLGQVPVEPVNIEVNFRSDKNLVNWVNRAFREALPDKSDAARGAVSFTAADAHHPHKAENRVQIHPILGRDDEREAELVLEQVKTIRLNAPKPESIAILVRSRPHLQSITAMLTRSGLPFRAIEIERLGTRPVIQDLMALTRALHHPADRVAWLALLRAPWCGLRLEDLLALTAGAKDETIWHCLRDKDRRQPLSAPSSIGWTGCAVFLNRHSHDRAECRCDAGSKASGLTWVARPPWIQPPICTTPTLFLTCWMNWTWAATCVAGMSSSTEWIPCMQAPMSGPMIPCRSCPSIKPRGWNSTM